MINVSDLGTPGRALYQKQSSKSAKKSNVHSRSSSFQSSWGVALFNRYDVVFSRVCKEAHSNQAGATPDFTCVNRFILVAQPCHEACRQTVTKAWRRSRPFRMGLKTPAL